MRIVYNGVALPFHHTLNANSFNVPSPEGGGDFLHTENTFTYEGVLTPDVPGLVRPGETFSAAVERVKALLRQPKKPLYVTMDGVNLQVDGTTDVNNGPIPGPVQVINAAGTQSCTIRFTVTCHTPICTTRSPSQQIMAVRWREQLAIDPATWAKRWTRVSVLHILPGQYNADYFRGAITPPIRSGYRRVQPPVYEHAEDGLSLRCTVVDEEQYVMPPDGAITIAGEAKVSGHLGMYQMADVTVTLTGSIVADKYRLFQTATVVAVRKLEDMGVQRIDSGKRRVVQILDAVLRTPLERNEVTVFFRARLAAPSTASGSFQWITSIARAAGQVLAGPLSKLLGLEKGEAKPGDNSTGFAGSAVNAVGRGASGNSLYLPKVFDPPLGLSKKPYGYDSNPPDPGIGGTGLSLVSAPIQDPCVPPSPIPFVGGWGNAMYDPNGSFSTSDRPEQQRNEPELKGKVGGTDSPGYADGPGGQRPPTTDPVPVGGNPQLPPGVVPIPGGFRVNPTEFDGGRAATLSAPNITVVSRPTFNLLEQQDAPPTLSALYTDYQIDLQHKFNHGYIARQEQREGGITRFVKVSSPSMLIWCVWSGECVGGEVQPPSTEWGDNYVVMDEGGNAKGVYVVAEDGVTMIHRRNGWVLIGVKDSSKVALGCSIAPWVAELLGREPVALMGPDGPPSDPAEFIKWRDSGKKQGVGELQTV